MRLLLYTAAIAVCFLAFGYRVNQMQNEVREHHAYVVEHQAELGSRIENLERAVLMEGGTVSLLDSRVDELNCVHYIYEDGSAVHLDAEIAMECIEQFLGPEWPKR